MKFVDKILQALKNFGEFLGDLFMGLFDLILKPLAFLLEILMAVVYFFGVLLEIVIAVVMLFVAFFQFLFALATGLIRTVASWVGFTPSGSTNLPSASQQGFDTFLDVIMPTGLVTIIPNVAIALLWLITVIKIVGLFGNRQGGSEK